MIQRTVFKAVVALFVGFIEPKVQSSNGKCCICKRRSKSNHKMFLYLVSYEHDFVEAFRHVHQTDMD